MFITLHEIFDILLMTALIGFIFKDAFPVPRKKRQILDIDYNYKPGFNWEGFRMACYSVGPAIIVHELAHKFAALGYGFSATFHAFYANSTTFLLGALAIVAKLLNWGFIFFVPGFVSVQGSGTALTHAIIAFAGPAVHLIFWIGSLLILRAHKKLKRNWTLGLTITKKVNMFLFILNMLPIPGIDGWQVYTAIYHAFF
ncbi:MAG: M50 family metallopeptidase [Nanoarchaeota archaeon]